MVFFIAVDTTVPWTSCTALTTTGQRAATKLLLAAEERTLAPEKAEVRMLLIEACIFD